MTAFDHVNNKASKEWLTAVLAAGGYLHSGEVVAVDQQASRIGTTHTSTFYSLDIDYSPGAKGTRPSRCLMKVAKPEMFHASRKEAAFYDRARRSGPTVELVTAFATAVHEGAQSAVILMEDREDCSMPSVWPLPPDIALCERAVRSLAGLHARWWNSVELGNPPFAPLILGTNPEEWSKFLAPFYESVGDGLSPARRATLELLTDRYPWAIKHRIEQTNAQTLVHGDAHFWNFLYPSDTSESPILIDWQSYFVHFGAYDLAYMIAVHWFPERRQRFETVLLHAYHDELQRHEIDYSFDDLRYDYRLQVAGQLLSPVAQCLGKVRPAIWWPHLDRAFSAFDDLDCRELL